MKKAKVTLSLLFLHLIIYGQLVINMSKTNGIYTVPCKVNGLDLNFIFDTGASSVCISLTEAQFMLKNDYIKESDIIGSSYSQIASGEIIKNTSINLRKIQIGDVTLYNINALIINKLKAPLLLGQSAIGKLGKYQIEGNKLILLDSNYKPKKKNSTQNSSIYYEIPNPNYMPTIEIPTPPKYTGESGLSKSELLDIMDTQPTLEYCFKPPRSLYSKEQSNNINNTKSKILKITYKNFGSHTEAYIYLDNISLQQLEKILLKGVIWIDINKNEKRQFVKNIDKIYDYESNSPIEIDFYGFNDGSSRICFGSFKTLKNANDISNFINEIKNAKPEKPNIDTLFK